MVIPYLERPKMALTLIGLWFPPEKYNKLYLVYRYAMLFLQYNFLLFNLFYMGIVWGDLEEVSEGSYLLFTQATLCLKATTFLFNKNILERLLEFTECNIFASQTLAHEKILAMQSQSMWRLYLFFLMCVLSTCVEWVTVPLFESGPRIFPFKICAFLGFTCMVWHKFIITKLYNPTENLVFRCDYNVNGLKWMPVDPANSPDYYIGYVYQTVAIFLSGTIFITVDFITISMINFASAQLDIIEEKINQTRRIPLGIDKKERENRLKFNNDTLNECIRQHEAVIRFVRMVEKMFNINIFFQMSGTVAIICVIGFRITIETPNSFHFYSTLSYLVTMLAQPYLYCWCGNVVTQRSQVIRDALYATPWYEQDQRYKRTLCIAMECMKRPIIFKTGYYIPLSRPTFVSILRCSYSYFAVLNQANNQ